MIRHRLLKNLPAFLILLSTLLPPLTPLHAAGVFRNGVGAESMALGGADVSFSSGPLSALASNPAGLGFISNRSAQLGVSGIIADASFENRADPNGQLASNTGVIPDAAFAFPLPSRLPITLGFALIPDSILSADWDYIDVPGGLDGSTSYGRQKHHSQITVLRSALGLGIQFTPSLSLGASVGVIYNRNQLESPYVFQTQPALQGFKTLLDLDTEGFSVNGNIGLLYRPHPDWQLGLAYTTHTRLVSDGTARGNANAQLQSLGGAFASVRPDFRYDAEVTTALPRKVSAGASWQALPRLRLTSQIDWIDWSDAFDTLRIRLTDGNNADLNAFVGSDSAEDRAPLDWKSRFVYRTGLEWALSDQFLLRTGYSYGKSPVPTSTLTPLTAAVTEHSIGFGVGFRTPRYTVDLAYQYDLPSRERVGQSDLRSGEYTLSNIDVSLHWIALTASFTF